jgi:DNA mismatch endonuclease (patch repair protein)
MPKVRRSGTAPELLVRRALRDLGYSYRCNVRSLPGTPDIANKSKKFAVLVHGCFWHRHPGCRRATMPKSNTPMWRREFRDNIRRDERDLEVLRRLGFLVITLWECEVVNLERTKDYIRFFLP